MSLNKNLILYAVYQMYICLITYMIFSNSWKRLLIQKNKITRSQLHFGWIKKITQKH